MDVSRYSKAIVAVIGGLVAVLGVFSEAVGDGVLSIGDVVILASALGTAFGVWRARNTEPSQPIE